MSFLIVNESFSLVELDARFSGKKNPDFDFAKMVIRMPVCIYACVIFISLYSQPPFFGKGFVF